jgi:hypothetical protein
MQFLITDIGNEDILLGYPWLASFEPRFSWRHAVIDERALPVIISSINPCIIRQQPIIAMTLTEEEKCHIIRTLESQSTIRGVSTELAIQAGQNKVAAEVPKVYEHFAKLLKLLRHGRDVHPTWVTFTMTGTLRSLDCGSWCESTKFEENLVSF